jgi:hypothetical protein
MRRVCLDAAMSPESQERVAGFGATAIDAATARREAAHLIRIYLSRLLNVTASD